MPSIMATPFPTRGMVLVEAMFADVPAATNICVTATNTVTGDVRQLHPYVSYNSDGCLTLSCGQAIFWDTEIPCGVAVQYCASAIASDGSVVTTSAAPLIMDTFTRVVANGWGTADSGQPWVNTSGLTADHLVNGTSGVHNTSVINSTYDNEIEAGTPNVSFYAEISVPVVPTGASIDTRHKFRRTDDSNYYAALVEFLTTGVVNLSFVKVVAGVQTFGSPVAIGTHVAGTSWAIVAQGWGNQIQLTGWRLVDPMPSTPNVSVTDNDLTTGTKIAARTRRDTGNTNGTVAVTWDNIRVTDVCADVQPIIACTENVTIACDGCFRLGDPVRPCNDVQVCMCYDPANGCEGTSGIFFAGMQPDVYASNTGLMAPVNSIYPIPISRSRRAAAGTFTLVPTSFTARDLLGDLLAAGGPLLWRGPAEYGTKDRYIQIGDVPVAPVLADLRIQPRVVDLPFVTAKGVVGPSQGICGARVEDLCDVYASWDALIAAGLSYADLLRGQAGTTPANLPSWNLVNATYASWNALNAGQTSWTDTLGGVP